MLVPDESEVVGLACEPKLLYHLAVVGGEGPEAGLITHSHEFDTTDADERALQAGLIFAPGFADDGDFSCHKAASETGC